MKVYYVKCWKCGKEGPAAWQFYPHLKEKQKLLCCWCIEKIKGRKSKSNKPKI